MTFNSTYYIKINILYLCLSICVKNFIIFHCHSCGSSCFEPMQTLFFPITYNISNFRINTFIFFWSFFRTIKSKSLFNLFFLFVVIIYYLCWSNFRLFWFKVGFNRFEYVWDFDLLYCLWFNLFFIIIVFWQIIMINHR